MMIPFSVNRGKHISPDILQLEREYVPNEEDIKYDYNPFSVSQIQPYIPIYSSFLDISPEDEKEIALNNTFEFSTLSTVIRKEEGGYPKSPLHSTLQKNVFIKFSPILDPIKYMMGKYDKSQIVLPSLTYPSHPKMDNPHNASYVDGFFCFLSSQCMNAYNVPHCIEYYGSHLGFQRKFKMVMDELDYLMNSPYFISNVNKQFFISGDYQEHSVHNSRSYKPKLHLHDDCSIDIDVIDIDTIDNLSSNAIADSTMDLIYANENEENVKDESSVSSDDNSVINYSSDSDTNEEDTRHNNSENSSDNEEEEDDDDEEEEEEEDEDEDEDDAEEEDAEEEEESESPELYAYINDFPVQMICLEKCVGTFDDLIMKGKIDEYTGASALFQIIMTLIIYQKVFHFTHNDLHTNNVMYVNTDVKYLYYKYGGVKYRVPTYGRIYKIIDFGRSIYEWNGNRICSDSFQNGGDAATQYNCEPFFNENKPIIEPNYSFDLCRLGVSIYDFVIDDDETPDDMDDFQKIVLKWCIDDNGKNVLYKKNGEERYPNFKLYKMIARTVHNHSPETQLNDNLFRDFKLSDIKWKNISKEKISLIDIDKMAYLGGK